MNIYLAGYPYKPWKELVQRKIPNVYCLDIHTYPISNASPSTAKNCFYIINQCDVVFAYISEEHDCDPISLTLELGYALGKGKPVVLACENKAADLDVLKSVSSIWFETLGDAIRYIAVISNE